MLVCITGVIGCGKSSVVEGLARDLNATPFYEPLPETDNFMLEAYYKDPARYAYSMQTLLLALRFRAQQEAQWRSQRGELCVMDSSLFSDMAFLEVQKQCGYVDEYEYKAYKKICEIHYPYVMYPDVLIHIDVPLDVEKNRICGRNRTCECGIPDDYLLKLDAAYNDLIPHLATKFPVVRIDGTKGKEEVLEEVKRIIDEAQKRLDDRKQWLVYKGGY